MKPGRAQRLATSQRVQSKQRKHMALLVFRRAADSTNLAMATNPTVSGRDPLAIGADPSRICTALRTALLAARNRDGGWGYAPGRQSRIEPTCWAELALGHSQGRPPNVDSIRRWKRQDDWLLDVPGVPPNVAFNALAALTLLQEPSAIRFAQPIIARLIQAKGLSFRQTGALGQDNSIQAWSWVDGTASWVEPTAWCLLLLKRVRSQSPSQEAAERIRVGEQFLFDRVCHEGGWNYGNPEVYGQKLWPYVPTTAVALLAMQDHREHPVVKQSLQQLKKDVASERSVVAVALTIVCLRTYGVATDVLEQAAIELAAGADRGNLLGTAMMLYALTDTHPQSAFAL
jgi:hypothetical protein